VINKTKILKDAQKYLAKSQWDKAIIEYEKLLADAHGDANLHNTIGDLYIKRNNSDKAIESFKKAAEIFNKSGFTLKSIALYKKVLNIKPDQVDIMLLLGKLNADRGMVGNANESYLAAASYFTKEGQRIRAVEIYKTLCDLNPDNLSLAQKLADLYMSEGLEKEGISKFIELAEKKAHQDDVAGARELLEKVASKGSDRFEYSRVLALLDLKAGRIPESVKRLEEVHKADPGDKRVLALLAEAYYRSDRYQDAVSAYRGLLHSEPGNRLYRFNVMNLLLKSGDYDAAWVECKHIIAADIAKKEYKEAEKIAKEFIGHRQESVEAREALVEIYSKSGQAQDAETVAQELERIKSASIKIEPELAVSETEPEPPISEPEPLPVMAEEPPAPPAESEPEPAPPEVPEEVFSGAAGMDDDFASIDGMPEDHTEQPSAGYDLNEVMKQFESDDTLGDISGLSGEDDNAIEIPDDDFGGLEDLGIFEITKGTEEASGQLDIVTDAGDGLSDDAEAPEAAVSEPNLSDMLREADVFIRRGQTGKAMDLIRSIEDSFAENPEVINKKLEVYKSLGDIDGFIDTSIELAGIYVKKGMVEDAQKVVSKAYSMDPDDERLREFLGLPSAEDEVQPVEEDVADGAGMAAEPPEREPEAEPQAEPALVDMEFSDIEVPSLKTELALDAEPALDELEAVAGMDIPTLDLEPLPDIEPALDELDLEEVSGLEASHLDILMDDISATSMAPGSVHYVEELAEADFYAQQGLPDEAVNIYERLLSVNPDDQETRAKFESLKGVLYTLKGPEIVLTPVAREEETQAGPPVEPETEEYEDLTIDDEIDMAFSEMNEEADTPESTVEAKAEYPGPATAVDVPAQEAEEFFDLGAELREELTASDEAVPEEHADAFVDSHLEEIFQEFKKGVEEQLNKEDYETHYNLGIAYKEMGMLDEAVSEFELAGKDPSRVLECASMQGLCHVEKGDYDAAIELFRKGLNIKGRDKGEYLGLRYDLACAFELKGDIASAQAMISEIIREDGGFRDVKDRLQRLNKALLDSGTAPAAKPAGTSSPKKNKVSYL